MDELTVTHSDKFNKPSSLAIKVYRMSQLSELHKFCITLHIYHLTH